MRHASARMVRVRGTRGAGGGALPRVNAAMRSGCSMRASGPLRPLTWRRVEPRLEREEDASEESVESHIEVEPSLETLTFVTRIGELLRQQAATAQLGISVPRR